MPFEIHPVTLQAEHTRLVPLCRDHHEGLIAAVHDGELWKLWFTTVPAPAEMAAEIDRRLALQADGLMLPFTVIDKTSGAITGMTTFCNIDAANRRLEIGHTWYAASTQRTQLNSQAKLLLLTHAFETLNCIAVEFRTNFFNTRSRKAIERLGAKLDGILRSHGHAKNGVLRDTCVYSIIEAEWPAVRANLIWLGQRS